MKPPTSPPAKATLIPLPKRPMPPIPAATAKRSLLRRMHKYGPQNAKRFF